MGKLIDELLLIFIVIGILIGAILVGTIWLLVKAFS